MNKVMRYAENAKIHYNAKTYTQKTCDKQLSKGLYRPSIQK